MKRFNLFAAAVSAALALALAPAGHAAPGAYARVEGHIMTRWAAGVNPESVLPEYPRPQMVRSEWANLNGLWDYAIRAKETEGQPRQPADWDGEILVPFCAESALSGVKRQVGPDQRLWYHREFTAPRREADGRLLLHFGAVDWDAIVWVNGKRVGAHTGGFDPFTFDITDALTPDGPQTLVVAVWDPTDRLWQPRGKQVLNPGGIFYTAVTGIWQTVWLEPVPATSIRSLVMQPDAATGTVAITVNGAGIRPDDIVEVRVGNGIAGGRGEGAAVNRLKVAVRNPRLWSPADPYLYDVDVRLKRGRRTLDRVRGYVGFRTIAVAKDADGVNRLMLNGEPLFQYGPLDQGWWPDGLYTAPTDEALRYDVEITRELGFNMIRKHVKVEPARWYYHCDRLGMLVWQDMPSGDRGIGGNQPDLERDAASAANFERELNAMIDAFRAFPSIIMWVPFNEGWGQFDTPRIVEAVRRADPSRLVNNASGWTDRGVGHVHDVHAYPGPARPPLEDFRAVVLGEFGGLGLPLEGHLWWDKRNWGYRTYGESDELASSYLGLMVPLRRLIGEGLSAAVYTQTTDVEGEVNGLLTYDREVVKIPVDTLKEAHRKLYLPPPEVRTLFPAADTEAQTWKYTTQAPPDTWSAPDFDDSAWKEGKGGFGTEGTPNTIIGTRWDSSDIWLRKVVRLPETIEGEPGLWLYHDEDADVYINGVKAASLAGYVTSYVPAMLAPDAKAALRPGDNVIAVHCRQTRGGQCIDVGLVSVIEKD